MQSAYKLPSSSAGAGKTIAIVDAFDDPNAQADLNVYRSTYGLPPCEAGCFTKVDQTGGTVYPKANAGWALEISLDLDMASAACPKCKILLVEAYDNSFVNLGLAVNQAAKLGATVISNSYGARELDVGKTQLEENSVYYNHPGIPQTVASGDAAYNNEEFSTIPCLNCSPSFPAGLASVISVGGTNLYSSELSRGWTENVWFYSGSGCTLYVAKPSWQTDKGCAKRLDNDVAAVASETTPVSVYDTYGWGAMGWQNVAGTSVSAPLVAGAIALNPTLTSEGAEGIYKHPTQWYDVLSGSNWAHIGECKEAYFCNAGVGFDGPTGFGTPNGGATSTPPSAVTEAASNVTTTSGTINGIVNPETSTTTYYFQYGHTKFYGKEVPTGGAAASGYTKPVVVSQALSGLDPASIYHYRVVASSAGGTTYGADRTFSTAPKVSLSTIGSKGTTEGKFEAPWGTATDALGNVWVSDFANNRIEEFSPSGAFIQACGSAGSGNGQFNGPTGIAVNPIGGYGRSGFIFVSDSGNNRVQIFTPECKFLDAFGTAGSGNGQLSAPMGLAFGQVSSSKFWAQPPVLLVADSGNNRLEAFSWNSGNEFLATYGSKGSGNGQFMTPTAIVRGGSEALSSEYFYVVDSGNNRVQKIEEKEIVEEKGSVTYAYLSQFGSKGSGTGQFSSPTGITLDHSTGDLAVTDTGNNRVEEFLPNGTYVAQFGTKGTGAASFEGPKGISVDSSGKLYVADTGNNRVAVWQSAPTYPPEWTLTPSPSPDPEASSSIGLKGVSCPASTTVCTAVGDYRAYPKAPSARPQAVRWNGSEWSLQSMPLPVNTSEIYVEDVSCPTSTYCMAVGRVNITSGGGVFRTVTEEWNGTEWKLLTTPEPAGSTAGALEGVSCTSSTACTTVGNYRNSSGVYVSLASRWNGTAWTVQTTPNPAGAKETKANNVSCPTTTACVMVGTYVNSSGVAVPFAEGWNGTTWSTQTVPAPSGPILYEPGVSCTAASVCTMAGSHMAGGTKPASFIYRWNGVEWKAQTPAVPAGSGNFILTNVTCATGTMCVAVGVNLTNPTSPPTVTSKTLAERWNGTEWVVQSTPNGASGGGGFKDVACASTVLCAAVGESGGQPLAELYG